MTGAGEETRGQHADIRARVEAATPGPWIASPDVELNGEIVEGGNRMIGTLSGIADEIGYADSEADAEFIAHARTDIVTLLDENEQLRAHSDIPEPCVMTHTEPFDFAECATHDETFPLGGACKFNDYDSIAEVYSDEADLQRGRAVVAEEHTRWAKADLEAARATIAAVRALVDTWNTEGLGHAPSTNYPDAWNDLNQLLDGADTGHGDQQ